MGTKVLAGQYYGVRHDGGMEPARPQVPDVVICRRVADFPACQPPASVSIEPCPTCGELIAFNPKGLYPDRPRTCLQCAGIEPLPLEQL